MGYAYWYSGREVGSHSRLKKKFLRSGVFAVVDRVMDCAIATKVVYQVPPITNLVYSNPYRTFLQYLPRGGYAK